jgi:uncharacterized protein YkwD
MLRRIVVFLLLTMLLIPRPGATLAAPRTVEISPMAARIIDLVNQQRSAAGLGALNVHAVLMTEAQRFSVVQADLGSISHRGNDGTNAGQRLTRAGYNWRFFGENLAAGHQTAEDVVAAWMKSPTHRAVVLHVKAREIGIGYTYRANDPNMFRSYYVMEVGQQR